MQSLTIPASVSKRKQACQSCRGRKKRCDAERPSCSLCKKWGIKCDYGVPSSDKVQNEQPTFRIPNSLQSILPALSSEADMAAFDNLLDISQPSFSTSSFSTPSKDPYNACKGPYPTPESFEALAADKEIDLDQILINAPLPCDTIIFELVNLFFEHLYDTFPCFHKKSFMAQVESRYLQTQAPMILYAICCVASRYHSHPVVSSRQAEWFEQAKFCYDLSQRTPLVALRTIQAALLLVVHGGTVGDFSSSWLSLGKAWRQAVALGMNRMDIGQGGSTGRFCLDLNPNQESWYGLEKSEGKTTAEREEYRRTLWLLFFLDRNHSWPTGWPNAIPERQFKVDIPVADNIFQSLEPDTEDNSLKNAPFTRNLNSLIASSSSARDPLNLFHYLCISHVLLGRITDLVHSLHDAPHTPEYAEECRELDAYIIKFRLSIPGTATSVLSAPAADRNHVMFLNLQLNTMTMLVHFRHTRDIPCTDPTSPYRLAVTAAKNTLQIIKDASRISTDLLMNHHFGSSFYIAACILVIEWRLTGNDSLKEDIDVFALVFDRMYEMLGFYGLKFKLALEHDVKRDMDEVLRLRERGFKGLLADCTKWGFVKQAMEQMGVNFVVT